ncbi:MAG: peptidylprolyl isomerase [Terriglobia bacterium]|jgi:peptidyl-prolyl cis-trans isomerase SurA
MRKFWVIASGLFFALGVVSLAEQKVLEEIVARVNDDIITRSDFEKSKQQLRQELGQQYFGTDLEREVAVREKNVLRDLIDQLLLIQKAKEVGISVDTELVKTLDRYRDENHLKTLDDLEREVTRQGVNYEDFKNNIRNGLFTQAVIRQEVGRRIQITQEEINKYYEGHKKELERPEEVRFREILISTEGKDESQVKEAAKKAADLAARAKKGEDFADLARKNSDGPTAKDGGEQDYIQRNLLLKEIADVVFSLKRNQVSDPILTKFGYKIIKLEDKHDSGIPTVDKVNDQISNALYMQQLAPQLRDYLGQLRQESYLEIKPGYVDSGATSSESKAEAKSSQ